MTASTTTVKLPSNAAHPLRTQLFINNEWAPSVSSQTFSVVNPATAQEIAQVSSAQKEDVDLAVQAARKAFKTTWGKNCLPGERTRLLNKLADLIERDAQLLGELESVNGGKGVRVARDFDIGDSVACLRYYAGWTDKITGETIEVAPSKVVYTTADPIGVCGQIIPWNYPIMMCDPTSLALSLSEKPGGQLKHSSIAISARRWAWKVGPALAAGCTIVMKPSELTPLTALAMCDLIVEAGFPAGVVNCVPGLGASAGAAIAGHMDIDKVAFTGSVQTGRTIMAAAALSNLKKVTLELGGKSPNIIFSSADLQQAANWSAMGVFYNSGQDCCAGTRLYVQEDIYDEFMGILIEKARACTIGDPLDEATSFGPLISATQRDKVLKFIESGVEEGAKIATGGQKWPQSHGFYVEPTILTECKPGMKVVREEIFGPVLVVSKFKTEEEALELANDSVYGLGAAVFTNDAKQSMRVAHKLEAGTVWCNLYGLLNSNVPFGGYKMSGIGRELGTAGVKEYCIIKSIHHNVSEEMSWPV